MAFLFQEDGADAENMPSQVEKHQDLLIFGYHCKLFRDDSRALAIDAGQHLIPWMGDSKLKIDRYDGRGHLFDLKPYDADNTEERGELSAEEIRIERLCEEERYLELHTDIAEKAIQEEEEIKRLNMELAESSGYQAVGFSYDAANGANGAASTEQSYDEEEEEDDQVFVPPPELCLPKSMIYPPGTKLNALIEKTAKYVGSHGGQMEIMIKTKQANNPQFDFLNFEHQLNPYYKHQVFMIKSGRYNPDIHNKPVPPKEASPEPGDSDDDEEYSGYLHPSLLAKSTTNSTSTESTVTLPTYTASQLENTAYGKLLKKMSDKLPSVTNSPQRVLTPTYSDTDNSQTGFTDQYLASTAASQAAAYAGSQTVHSQAYPGSDYYDYSDQYSQEYYSQYYQSYDSPSVTDDSIQRPASPPTDVKPLIERLLTYIKKDGEEFEKQVLQRQDERFSFLRPEDVNYPYYYWRKQALLGFKSNSPNMKGKGVSFSIKQKEPEVTSIDTTRAALPVDPESDDEHATDAQDVYAKYTERVSPAPVVKPPPPPRLPGPEERPPQADETLQKKLAEQKLRDKLAAAAREKMTQVSQNTKDKSLQAERKRRAAMFVNMLKNKQKDAPYPAPIGPSLPPAESIASDTRLADTHTMEDLSYHSNSYNSQSRSPPPSAYSAKNHRHHDSHSRRESTHRRDSHGSHRHRDSYDSHRKTHSRHRDTHSSDNSSSSHRRRRSPSPVLSLIKRRKSRSPTHGGSRSDASSRRMEVSIKNEDSGANTPSADKSEDDNSEEFMLKVRKMLKASRQAVFKEDVFGN